VRSIRSRLLVTTLSLISFVVLILSWYVYTETAMALRDKKVATQQLLYSKFKELSEEFSDRFDHELRRQAERLAAQAVSRVEFVPFHPVEFIGVLTEFTHPLGYVNMPHWSRELVDERFIQRLRQHSSLQVMDQGRLFDPNSLEGHADEYFQIHYRSASQGYVSQHSNNLIDNCLNLSDYDRQNLRTSDPVYRDIVMACGKPLRCVMLKRPLGKTQFSGSSQSSGIGRMAGSRPRNGGNDATETAANRKTSAAPRPGSTPGRNSGEGRGSPIFVTPTIIVQVARESAVRDSYIQDLQGRLQDELKDVAMQSEQARRNLINRLALICLGTISATALGVTWLSRRSLKPLVQVADAVSHLTPKDLRLKIDGKEIQPRELPEELEPIVQRLQESLESLESAFAREKRATADISHELRTPLASLMATAQVALRKTRTPEEYKTTLQQCVETGTHLTTLVERLLMLSRLDAGVDQLRTEPVDVLELAGQCVDMLRPLADHSHVEVELDVDDSATNMGLVESDAGKLREILVNLIDNAVHYNKPEGHVTLRVSATATDFVLEVIDTGMGMTEATRGHLFERFYRADPSRNSETVNAGLGLAIVKGYVDLFGGKIEVVSELNRGSTFRVILPRVAEIAPVLAA
jgi:signal transduction histidine kinase